MVFNLPVLLTWLRIAFIPLLVFLFYLDRAWAPLAAATVFGLAGLTDWADGYLARLWRQESRFGAFLDPVADKLIVAVALILLVEREASIWMTLAAAIIIGREIVISALREWMAESGTRSKVAVAFIGKLKTTAQIIALIFLLYNQDLFGVLPMRELGVAALAIATLLTLISMIQYLRSAFEPE
ncbi:MAG: CDP-diacylglycerol--glycerol-3-phosphate 3-phosphatidyltransferase [Candidatus Thiothrix singaporensis]|uniref:CDP-diacylglycerol--glycerol-3-phosphate 3-phosphatidyltransferase n=1 Tax=Candidatus Thiothrix singaporensis TaxID=2799669 RepID=A0A7L6AQ25_9GAMM|nr:MAG: CDP-diacylglycerol--glycerol-3-phosphate 3-phosphatidyltransferase [Candidatus Thiothrix singaporensis]